jgi:hypothetical protein
VEKDESIEKFWAAIMTIQWRVLRLSKYLAIGFIIATVVGVAAVYTPSSIERKMSGGWIGLVFWTPLVFGYAVRQLRRLWRRPSFWFTLSGILVTHLLGFTLVLRNYAVRPFWFGLISAVEMIFITMVLDTILPRSDSTAR